jgi:hypothetical protein
MEDRLFFPIVAVVVLAMIALAAVWPQGLGRRSPPPFGFSPPVAAPPSHPLPSRPAP